MWGCSGLWCAKAINQRARCRHDTPLPTTHTVTSLGGEKPREGGPLAALARLVVEQRYISPRSEVTVWPSPLMNATRVQARWPLNGWALVGRRLVPATAAALARHAHPHPPSTFTYLWSPTKPSSHLINAPPCIHPPKTHRYGGPRHREPPPEAGAACLPPPRRRRARAQQLVSRSIGLFVCFFVCLFDHGGGMVPRLLLVCDRRLWRRRALIRRRGGFCWIVCGSRGAVIDDLVR